MSPAPVAGNTFAVSWHIARTATGVSGYFGKTSRSRRKVQVLFHVQVLAKVLFSGRVVLLLLGARVPHQRARDEQAPRPHSVLADCRLQPSAWVHVLECGNRVVSRLPSPVCSESRVVHISRIGALTLVSSRASASSSSLSSSPVACPAVAASLSAGRSAACAAAAAGCVFGCGGRRGSQGWGGRWEVSFPFSTRRVKRMRERLVVAVHLALLIRVQTRLICCLYRSRRARDRLGHARTRLSVLIRTWA